MKRVYMLDVSKGGQLDVSDEDFTRLVAAKKVDEMGTTLVYGIADVEETTNSLREFFRTPKEEEAQ